MFARGKRLSRAAFPAALKGGRRVPTAHFTLITGSGVPGYAVVVPKQVARLSVARHKVKRRVTGYLEAHQGLPEGLVVTARAGAPLLTPAETRAELAAGLLKLGQK